MKHDRQLAISTGGSRKALSWAGTAITWGELAERLRTPIRGSESHAAYMRMSKAQQDTLKDIGGFVGGTLRGGRRKAANVIGRDLITLDLDAIPKGGTQAVLDAVAALGCASCVYSTRKHDADHPRLRVVIPLEHTAAGEEYEPIARRVAEWLGIGQCDPTTFQSYRLMYWPSASADSEFIYDLNDEPFLNGAEVLSTYQDWRDMRSWPQVPGQAGVPREAAAKAEDPETKPGLVGAFCRVYDIRKAMEELIPGSYAPTDDPDRYTYTGGSTAGGAIVYEDKWLYSHHATDPASGRLVNAWDLVRLHKFGDRDGEGSEGTPVNRLPSTDAMKELALSLPAVRRQALEENRAQITEDFGTADPDGNWLEELELDKKGNVCGSLKNLRLIFDNDPALQCIGQDRFLGNNYVYDKLPWSAEEVPRPWLDRDDDEVSWYIEVTYKVTDLRRIKMATNAALGRHPKDALREYLEGLPPWDGVQRVDTLLVRYFKADDTPYTRAVTRKFMAAAVARGMNPGCKFDNVLTLIGAQGTAKSLFADILGGEWYNDNLQTFVGKDASEQLRGVWIVELPEVDRFSAKYEAAAVKQFITRRDDIYRVPFERRTTPHPRRCVFIATTNEPQFLTDNTGNRRWWIVPCRATPEDRGEDMASLRRDRDQVWAEALEIWRKGEPLTLPKALSLDASALQENAVPDDPWAGLIAEFLEKPLPPGWLERTPEQRMAWWSDDFGREPAEDLEPRRQVCVMEIWCELLGQDRVRLDGRSSRRITNVIRRLPGWSAIGPKQTVYGAQRCFYRDGWLDDIVTTQITKDTKTTKSSN